MTEQTEEEYEEEEEIEEEEQPVKRRVVGRMPKQGRYIYHRRQEQEFQPQQQQTFPIIYPQQSMGQQPFGFKPSPEQIAREQAYIEILKSQEIDRYNQQMYRQQQPRVSTSKKLLNVANEYAGTKQGSTGAQRVNNGITGCMFKKPSVTPIITAKKSVVSNFNNFIKKQVPVKKKGR